MKKFQPLLLSVVSGCLLWASWPVSPFTWLIFMAFVPLLWIEHMSTDRLKFFCYTFLTLLIWNIGATWWICNSTVPGGIAAIIANSLLMCLPWLGFYNVKRRLGNKMGYLALVACWLTFEYVHLTWQLSWPWLTLGNVFATHANWVQWYEFTGSSGGSLWVLLTNIILFHLLVNREEQATTRTSGTGLRRVALLPLLIAILGVPLLASVATLHRTQAENTGKRNFVVVQPNIDPYQKFEAGSQGMQLQQLISLSESKLDTNTAVVVWPETAINAPQGIDETRLRENPFLAPVWRFLERHPHVKLLTGIEGFRMYNDLDKTVTARHIPGSNTYYDTYNTAAFLDSTGPLQLYHKSKFVPGVETLPSFLRFLDRWFEQFGGTTGGYAPQAERTVLKDEASGFRIAPAICYESIYGEFLTAYMRNGANIIVIITNDGWWGNTSGHKQHMQYATLRAIETRRWVVRSANTGISCFISPVGAILQPQPWDTSVAIKMVVPTEERLTLFARTGDIISRVAYCIALALLLASSFVWVRRRYFLNQSNA